MIAAMLCRLLSITMILLGVPVATWSIYIVARPSNMTITDRFRRECVVEGGERNRSSTSGCNDPRTPPGTNRMRDSVGSRHGPLTAILHERYRVSSNAGYVDHTNAGFGYTFWCPVLDSSQYLVHRSILPQLQGAGEARSRVALGLNARGLAFCNRL